MFIVPSIPYLLSAVRRRTLVALAVLFVVIASIFTVQATSVDDADASSGHWYTTVTVSYNGCSIKMQHDVLWGTPLFRYSVIGSACNSATLTFANTSLWYGTQTVVYSPPHNSIYDLAGPYGYYPIQQCVTIAFGGSAQAGCFH